MADSEAGSNIVTTPGAKMMYLIRRKPTTTREELVAHWFANHMPVVIESQKQAEAAGKLHALRYIATLFDADGDGQHAWDGVAQLWWDRALPRPTEAHGTQPTDSFQEKAEPYVPWGTTEYVIMDGSEQLQVKPLTLNDPFPCTRSNFYKVTYLVKARAGADYDAFYAHWLSTHVPNARSVMEQAGGFRYVVSHSIEPQLEPYAGMAELYFPDESAWSNYRQSIQADGMEEWMEPNGTLRLTAQTEMIGLP